MIEMAVGIFIFVLVLSALIAFGRIIPEAMRLQSEARCKAGYEAQSSASEILDNKKFPQVDGVLAEPEVQPERPPRAFAEAMQNPCECRMMSQSFSVDLADVSNEWLWQGATKFRGLEECHMPVMTIPEFSKEGGMP
ncbi:MAG: hypothetical protein II649_09425 [Kiritimatiellae bacterium]|nr:hypothetical protein [Kiritimatiellia bacterium]